MLKRFFLARQGLQVGPYTVNEVLEKLQSNEHAWNDYIFEESREDWMLILEHPLFSSKYNEGWARSTLSETATHPFHEKKWVVFKDEKKFGPFTYLEIVQMMQEKTLVEQDQLATLSQQEFKKIKEFEEFSAKKVKQLLSQGDRHVKEVFNRRRYPRAEFEGTLIVHDNKTVFRGQSFQISAGGAGLLIPSQALQPGQTLLLHFHPTRSVPAFNAVASVVSKLGSDLEMMGTPHKYGVRFTSLSQTIKDQIYTFTSTLNKKEAA